MFRSIERKPRPLDMNAAPIPVSTQASLLDLDGAWLGAEIPALPRIDATVWGPKLRFTAPGAAMEAFYRELGPGLGRFILSGSGDFHHLTALFLRRIKEPFLLISFDNHPDWDRRPPRWACGGWVNRALEIPQLRSAAIWGCGNNELGWPNRIFGNRAAVRQGRLRIFPWQERYRPHHEDPWTYISWQSWRDAFEIFTGGHAGERVYVTIDMDCLRRDEAATNWENGLFTADDLAWALGLLRSKCSLIGGDVCGAWSPPEFDRLTQRFASSYDHPKLEPVDPKAARSRNRKSLEKFWPVLAG